jgi:DNA-binding GntR family transcriptional regulator
MAPRPLQALAEGNLSLADRIADVLAARIVEGRLQPGVPVRQDHIAVEFGASHVPVREAFRTLEAQGLLVSEPRRGVRVAPLDAASVREVVAMRVALETLALRHALPGISSAHIAAAEAAIAEGRASREIAVWEAANRRFHRAIIQACAMPRLLAAIDQLHQESARYLFAAWSALDWQLRSDDEHEAILALIRGGQMADATRALADHIQAAGDALVRSIEAKQG